MSDEQDPDDFFTTGARSPEQLVLPFDPVIRLKEVDEGNYLYFQSPPTDIDIHQLIVPEEIVIRLPYPRGVLSKYFEEAFTNLTKEFDRRMRELIAEHEGQTGKQDGHI